jgi:hypothetical protein
MWKGVMKQDWINTTPGSRDKYICIGAWIFFSALCTLGILS